MSTHGKGRGDYMPDLVVRNGNPLKFVCRKGCAPANVKAAVLEALAGPPRHAKGAKRRVKPARPPDHTFLYVDADGDVLYRVKRWDERPGQPKTFAYETIGPDGHPVPKAPLQSDRVPYHLPKVNEARIEKQPVLFVEGELKAEALQNLGFAATCVAGGANTSLRGRVLEPLHGCDVVLLADNDKPGRKFMVGVRAALNGKAAKLRTVDLRNHWNEIPAGGDIVDWLEADPTRGAGAVEQLLEGGDEVETKKDEKEASVASVIYSTCEEDDLFRDSFSGDAYVCVREPTGGPQTWEVDSPEYRDLLADRYHAKTGGAASNVAIGAALNLLRSRARRKGDSRVTYRRVCREPGGIYIDLCDPLWRVIMITPAGWEVLDASPVHFVRTTISRPLPEPARSGGGRPPELELADCLQRFLKYGDEPDASSRNLHCHVGWMLCALGAAAPYPILYLCGPEGSAKTFFVARSVDLVDPSGATTRFMPHGSEAMMLAASNTHVVAFDNVGHISAEQSDAICVIATGGAYTKRKHYENSREHLRRVLNPVIISGIGETLTAADALDRATIIELPRIRKRERKRERKLLEIAERLKPAIFGLVCDLLARGLQRIETLSLESADRMADAEAWMAACSSPEFDIHAAYRDARAAGEDVLLDNAPFRAALVRFAHAHAPWEGEATAVLEKLNLTQDEATRRDRFNWPQTPGTAGKWIRRAEATLEKHGVEVRYGRTSDSGRRKLIYFSLAESRVQEKPSEPSGARKSSKSRRKYPDGSKMRPSEPSAETVRSPKASGAPDGFSDGSGVQPSSEKGPFNGHSDDPDGSDGFPKTSATADNLESSCCVICGAARGRLIKRMTATGTRETVHMRCIAALAEAPPRAGGERDAC